jgi:hypothetical protein
VTSRRRRGNGGGGGGGAVGDRHRHPARTAEIGRDDVDEDDGRVSMTARKMPRCGGRYGEHCCSGLGKMRTLASLRAFGQSEGFNAKRRQNSELNQPQQQELREKKIMDSPPPGDGGQTDSDFQQLEHTTQT